MTGKKEENKQLIGLGLSEGGEVNLLKIVKEELPTATQRKLPIEQKVTRALIAQTHTLQRNLFDVLETTNEDAEGNVMYSKLPNIISEYDFRGYILAAKTILFDQSYLFKNEDTLTGFTKQYSNITTTDGLQDEKGQPYLNGNICVTLNDLCRVAYGIPEDQSPLTSQRNNMRKTIEAVHAHPIGIVYANGDIRETRLIVMMDKYKRKSDGAECYHLILNPIFTTQGKGYGLMLRGATTRLTLYLSLKGKTGRGGKSAAHYAFLELLSIQDLKKGVWNISTENLLLRLNLMDMYRKNKKRAIEKLAEIFEAFVALGYLLESPNPTIPTDGVYHFKLHQDPKKNIGLTDPSTPT